MALRVASALCASALLGSAQYASSDASGLYQRALRVRWGGDAESSRDHGDSEAVSLGAVVLEDPITGKPWTELDRHQANLGTMHRVLKSISDPLGLFLGNCTRLKSLLRADVMENASSTVPELATSMAAMLSSTRSQWFDVASGMIAGFNFSDAEALSSQGEVMDVVYQVVTEVDRLTKHVSWLVETGARVLPAVASSSAALAPAELGTLKAAAATFAEQRDASSNAINRAMQDLLAHLSTQLMDPISLVGYGKCTDASGHAYSTLERPGCESRLNCLNACRKFNQTACRGATFHKLANGCGHCELRVESGFAGAADGWSPEWTGGSGTGPVSSTKGANATSDGQTISCYGRESPEWQAWPPLMRSVLVKELEKLQEGYFTMTRLWRSGLFKMDRAFWQIESALAESSAKILALQALPSA